MNPPVTTYSWPSIVPRSDAYGLRINGQPVDVLSCSVGAYALCSIDGPASVEIDLPPRVKGVTVRPKRYQINPEIAADRLCFTVPGPCHLVLEIPDQPTLFLFADAPETSIPAPDAPNVTAFAPGQVHEIGVYEARANETIYIPGGAVLRGAIRVRGVDGVRVCGRGIIDNSALPRGGGTVANAWLSVCCEGSVLEGITFVESQTWTVKSSACKDVQIENIKILALLIAADGIDICGSEDVNVRGCFVCAGDDCLAVKSVEYRGSEIGYTPEELCLDTRNITFEDCAVLSHAGGSALEMGHEFRCREVSDVTWLNIDVLGVHNFGSAFSIRHCDGALIQNVRYEDIRVEHHYNELIGFRIVRSRYSKSPERGRVENVVFKDILVDVLDCNLGYSLSHIGGYDPEHGFKNITFDHFVYNGTPVTSLDDFDCYTKYATDITFQP